MKIGVVGAREGRSAQFVHLILDGFVQKGDTIISGGAAGVDSFAREYTTLHQINYLEFPPDFSKNSFPWATPYAARNRKIAEECEVLLAFPTESPGTWQTIGFAKQLGKRVIVFTHSTVG